MVNNSVGRAHQLSPITLKKRLDSLPLKKMTNPACNSAVVLIVKPLSNDNSYLQHLRSNVKNSHKL